MGFDADWPRISEILENAISSLASGESDDVAAVLDAAAEEISRIR
jgi:multiple sugar transport system substrate-binding protein